MKFKVQMKDPDGIYDSVRSAAINSIESMKLDKEEWVLLQARLDSLHKAIREWFENGEYVTIEVDTEAMTATVCKARE